MHVSLDSALGRQRRLNQVGESITQIAPDPAAAYSLRSLTGSDPKVVRVRRGSDNHEQDFTASEVSAGALVDFVNAQVVAPLDIQELEADGRTGDFLIAKAAYSLRSLGTRQATVTSSGDTDGDTSGKFVVQVRRSSDDAVKSFTADEVTDGTLLSFVNENIELFSNNFETNTSGFNLNTAGSNTAVHNTSDGFSGSGCLQLNLTSNLNTISTVGTDKYMQDTDGVTYTVSFYAKAVSGSTNLVVKIGTVTGSQQQISFSENGGEWVKYSLTFVNNFGAGSGDRNKKILFAGSTSDTTEWRIDDFQIFQTTSDGFVSTWYDQSVTNEAGDTATGNHATQATAASQPKIVDAGALVTGGLDFDGVDDGLFTASNLTDTFQSATFFALTQDDTTSGIASMVRIRPNGASGTVDGLVWEKTNNVTYAQNTLIEGANGCLNATSLGQGTRNTSKNLNTLVYQQSQILAYENGALDATLNSISAGFVPVGDVTLVDQLWIGQNFDDNNRPFNGTMSEVIIYFTDQTDNRTAIEANIGEAYSITGIPAYDNTVDGFVETWYDQSGNGNDAVQATAGSQPKIVSAGSLIAGGLRFDDAQNLETAGTFSFASGTTLSTFITNSFDTNENSYLFRFSSNYIIYGISGGQRRVAAGTNVSAGVASGSEELWSTISTLNSSGGTTNFFVDGTLTSSADANIGTNVVSPARNLNIGGSSSTTHWNGTVNEVIFYATDQSANRPAIEANINNQYDIY